MTSSVELWLKGNVCQVLGARPSQSTAARLKTSSRDGSPCHHPCHSCSAVRQLVPVAIVATGALAVQQMPAMTPLHRYVALLRACIISVSCVTALLFDVKQTGTRVAADPISKCQP